MTDCVSLQNLGFSALRPSIVVPQLVSLAPLAAAAHSASSLDQRCPRHQSGWLRVASFAPASSASCAAAGAVVGAAAGARRCRAKRAALAAAVETAAVVPVVKAPFGERWLAHQARARDLPVEGRPRYVGCTESGDVREGACRALLRSWPGGDVDEFWSVVGGLSGLDSLSALAQARIKVNRIVLFDRDPLQLEYGELILALVEICATRERFVAALFGRSMAAWGRLVGVSSMLDFLDQPLDDVIEADIAALLPPRLREVYAKVFACVAGRQGWPLVWPSFGRAEKLPIRELSTSKKRLGGGRNEALHVNEVGWLRDEESYARVRDLTARVAPEFELLDLNAVAARLRARRRVVFISNIDTAPQFMAGEALADLRASLLAAAAKPARLETKDEGGDGCQEDEAGSGSLLLSTTRAEWLGVAPS